MTPIDAVDRFLRRSLTESMHSKVKTCEACILGATRAVRFVVVTDTAILLTENPPKKLTEYIRLVDIVSIESVCIKKIYLY